MGETLALVTGAPGWAGSRLVHHLRAPHPDWPPGRPPRAYDAVRCLVAPGAPTDGLQAVEVVRGDLRDEAAVRRFTTGAEGADLFHFAGVIHPRRLRDLHEVNARGTRTLLRHAAIGGVRRVVALSSNSPVGVSRDPAALFDETTPCRPYLAYGRSKLEMERAVHGAGIDSTVLRACWFYGPGQPERQTAFMRMVRAGRAPLIAGGEARRSLSYVDAIALGALLAAGSPHAVGRTYWIADARPYPMREIIATLETVLREDFSVPVAGRRLPIPAAVCEGAAWADRALQRMGLYQQHLHVLGEMHRTIACSVAEARRQLGFRPGPGLREGMRRSVEWCLRQGIAV